MERVDEAPPTGVSPGYLAPDVVWHGLDEDTLRRIVNDDEEVAGLFASSLHDFFFDEDQVEGAAVVGSAVGDSIRLRKLEIQGFYRWDEDEFLPGTDQRNIDFLPALAHNRLLEQWNSDFLPGLARNRSIEHLAMVEGDFLPNSFDIISPFFMHNHNLRCIEIHCCDLSENFPSFLLSLSTCATNQLERIHLYDNDLGGIQVTRIIKALTEHRNLREIYLCGNEISRSGFMALSRLLQHPHSKIHRLEIGDKLFRRGGINDVCITILTGAMVVNKTIKILHVSAHNVTATGWRVFSGVLCSPICSLETLSLKHSDLDDEGITAIGDALIKNKTLKCLNLPSTDMITINGWRSFARVLQSGSKVKTLEVGGANFNEEVVTDFATALVNNSSLSKLRIEGREYTDSIWGAFSRVLDVSCVRSTYLSNHTLHTLEIGDRWHNSPLMVVPEDLARVLQMNTNENEDKVALARQRIFAYHFSGDNMDIQEFSAMAVPILPHAIEWIGRDLDGFPLMYHVMRGIPALFDRNT